MTVGVKEDPIFTLIILVDTIPVMQFEGFLAIDKLSTDRTASCLLPQVCCTKRRGPLQRQVTVSILEGSLPERIEWIRVALDLDMTLGFDRCLYLVYGGVVCRSSDQYSARIRPVDGENSAR